MKLVGQVAGLAVLVFLAVFLYKKAFGKCGCSDSTPTKLALPTLSKLTTDFGAKKEMMT